jgi:hypothetical protein
MTAPVILPAISITRGQRAAFQWRYLTAYPAARTPVDLSDWTGLFTLALNYDDAPLLTVPCALGVDGFVRVTLQPADTAELAGSQQIGGRVAAVFQVTLTAPQPELSQAWQGGASIARAQK